jgi:4-hydroxy 2-oxovalerate aldolase
MKILDCTLRDGGYYTNWDFDSDSVETYIESFNHLPVDYLEIGYRSNPMKEYLGEFFYLPEYVLKGIRGKSNKKLAVILNEKDIRANDANSLLKPCKPYLDMVRIAVAPDNFERALKLGEAVKKLGFEVSFNVMYMSEWENEPELMSLIPNVDGIVDYFYLVDSFGGVFPKDVKRSIDLVKSKTDVKLGFHGHNNLEMALSNTLMAIEEGVDIVDATITGMGRGAGNLKMELLLTVLNSQGKVDLEYNWLSKVTDVFSELQKQYDWGTNLPYMVSGANSIPQKQVMEWVSKRFYSFNSIIRALANQSKGIKDNKQLPTLNFDEQKYNTALIIGGGPTAVRHAQAINELLKNHPDMVVIHASSKNALNFQDIKNDQYFCLVGNEGYRLESVFNMSEVKGRCILPPFPRKMGTYIPEALADQTYELSEVNFTDSFEDSHTALALQTAIELKVGDIYVVGYDGYNESKMGEKERELFNENEYLFEKGNLEVGIQSLTPTKYSKLPQSNIYSLLS